MATTFNRRSIIGGLVAGTLLARGGIGFAAEALKVAPLDDATIDTLAADFMKAFDVPGLSVCVVRPGQAPFAKGYGVRTLGQPGAVDGHTLFAVASNSKAFTSAALALLVDEKKLAWDDPVTKHLPEFEMYDPAVTKMMTVRDLLIHNSGLPLGAGDLMFFPRTDISLAEAMHGLRYLKPDTGFRTTYAYDNQLYLVAGMIITRITGQNWDAFVQERLLKPLGMGESVARMNAPAGDNIAGRHARLGPPVRGMGPMKVVTAGDDDTIGAAGGLRTSAHDIAAWFNVQLAKGALPDGKRLWSEEQSAEMWKPRTITGSGPGPDEDSPNRSVLGAYALGWFVAQFRNQRILHHSGGLLGQVTQQAMLPELGCAVAVYTNVEDGWAAYGLNRAIVDRLIGSAPFDWLAMAQKRRAKADEEALATLGGGLPKKPEGKPSLPLAAYAGRYRDPWYGDVVIATAGKGLTIDFTRTAAFKGPLEIWGKDAFRTHFSGEDIEDAVLSFAVADGKVTGIKLKALSPLADFSFDFHDLDLKPVL
jgi:CubicO group peptidase (beta-lactamase class C family)